MQEAGSRKREAWCKLDPIVLHDRKILKFSMLTKLSEKGHPEIIKKGMRASDRG